MPKYKKVPNNESAIEIDGKVVLSFDPRYKEYLKWREENPKLEQELVVEKFTENIDDDYLEVEIPKRKSKDFEFYWKNGNIMAEGNFVGNLKVDGQWLWYYENGNIRSKVNYRYGFKYGLFQYYYKNGNIKVQGKYKKDKRNGVWLINGVKRKYKNGKEL
jgi:antitoxin component YwqK of YwqJK toxin-antitoxin module